MKNLAIYRVILIVTTLVGMTFVCSVPENIKGIVTWSFLGLAFGGLYLLCYRIFKNLSDEQIKKILMVDTFKKFGIDIDED